MAIMIRCRMPPGELMRVVVEPLGGVRDADLLEQLERALAQRAPVGLEVRALHVDHLAADREGRIQAGQRILEDHRDLLPAQCAQLLTGQCAQIAVAEDDRVRRGSRRSEAGAGSRVAMQRRLATAGFAHDADDLARRTEKLTSASARSTPLPTW